MPDIPLSLSDAWLIWLSLANFITMMLYGIDKWKARNNRERVPERILLMWAALGGGVGALIAMGFFRHKIRKPSFWVTNFAGICALAYAMRDLLN